MRRIDLASFSALIIVLLKSVQIFSLIIVESEELGGRRCWEIRENLSNCEIVGYDDVVNLLNQDYKNITSPRISIYSLDENFHFTVRLRNTTILRQVRAFAMMNEKTEVDIELEENAQDYEVSCFTLSPSASAMTVTSNIVVPFVPGSLIEYRNFYFGYPSSLRMRSTVSIVPQTLQSGYFTCSSKKDEWNVTETFRIFVQHSKPNDTSPFVSVRESTIQSDEAGNGFIVPCRTNYRLRKPPHLLWKRRVKEKFIRLTDQEMQGFEWDPNVGFQFEPSIKMWERGIIACEVGTFVKEFVPSPSIFEDAYVVMVRGKEIGCAEIKRNNSPNPLVRSHLYDRKVYSHTCFSDVGCDLDWKMGLLFHQGRYQEQFIDAKNKYAIFHHPSLKFGMISCSATHEYEDIFVPEAIYSKFFVGLDSNVYLLPGYYPASSVIGINLVDKILYKQGTELYQEFICTITFVMSQPVYLILRYEDQSEIVHEQEVDWDTELSSEIRFNVTLHTNMTHAVCLGFTNEGKVMSARTPVKVVDTIAPLVNNAVSSLRTLKVGDVIDDQTLICPITAAPPPKYQWIVDEKNFNLTRGTDKRILTFRQIDTHMAGKYTCVASNAYGNASFDFQVSVQTQDFFSSLSQGTQVGIALSIAVGCIVLLAAVVFAWKYYIAKRQIRNLTPEEAQEFLDGSPTTVGEAPCHKGSELALHLPFTRFIEPKSLVCARDAILGKGQFGIVYRGFFDGEAVAVKTFKRAVTYEEFRAGLVEVKLMSFVGHHPNVVKFIGADVSNIKKREIFVVMELSPNGSLEKYLRTIKPSLEFTNGDIASQYYSTDERITRVTLFGFCEQIAFALEYLDSKRVIHGDLAARNVLVFSHGVVKVTDFGYSRQLYENSMYKPKANRALPWRWASIELLRQMEFSTESDIWAFGVTVWEIFTFGNVPFATEVLNSQFVVSLENGLRLQKPSGLSEPQYSFLKECWNLEKSARPRFSTLKSFFATEKEDFCKGFQTAEVQ